MIQNIIEKENQSFFEPRTLRIDFLKNCPAVIPTLAEWMYREWSPYDKGLTKAKLIDSFNNRLNDDAIPIALVILRGENPVGMVSLKGIAEPEFSDDFSEHSAWIGGLHVLPEERNQGLGQELVKVVQIMAKEFGHQDLYVYTSNPNNVEWYRKRNAVVIKERPHRGHMITIMKLSVEM